LQWLQIVATVLYVVGLLSCGGLVWKLLDGGMPKPRAVQAGLSLALAALLVGLLLAAQIVTSLDLWRLSAVYAPYFALAAWSLYFSLLLQRGSEPPRAAVLALIWTVPSLALTPLAIGILEFLLPPR
jgi:hypothetical protein